MLDQMVQDNIVGKGENAAFSPFALMFSRGLFSRTSSLHCVIYISTYLIDNFVDFSCGNTNFYCFCCNVKDLPAKLRDRHKYVLEYAINLNPWNAKEVGCSCSCLAAVT